MVFVGGTGSSDFNVIQNCTQKFVWTSCSIESRNNPSPTRKPVGFMQSCCFVFNGNETKTCLLCNSYLFGMNNVLYIE